MLTHFGLPVGWFVIMTKGRHLRKPSTSTNGRRKGRSGSLVRPLAGGPCKLESSPLVHAHQSETRSRHKAYGNECVPVPEVELLLVRNEVTP